MYITQPNSHPFDNHHPCGLVVVPDVLWVALDGDALAVLSLGHVGDGGHVARAAEADLEPRLHRRLVHARERPTRVRRLELRRGDVAGNRWKGKLMG